jgi:hypothetical protein
MVRDQLAHTRSCVCMCVRVCVCYVERERERGLGGGLVCNKAFYGKYTPALTFQNFCLEPPHPVSQSARRGRHRAVGLNGKSRPTAAAQRRSVVHGLRAWVSLKVSAKGKAEEVGGDEARGVFCEGARRRVQTAGHARARRWRRHGVPTHTHTHTQTQQYAQTRVARRSATVRPLPSAGMAL